MALTETWYLWQFEGNKEAVEIINSHTISNYRVALQYWFNAEYNKLLQKCKNSNNRNISSLYKVLESIETAALDFHSLHEQGMFELTLLEGDFQAKQRELRDKKFSHSDMHPINNPFQIKGLTMDQIEEGFEHI